MPWNRWYSFKSYVSSALWIVPLIALVVALVVKRLAERLGGWMVKQGFYDLTTGFLAMKPAEAQGVLDRIFTLNLSFLVFTFGSLLVAIQVAGGQYTPRIIATTLLRDNVIRYIVGLFVFTMLWANRTMVQLGEAQVPQFQVFLALMFGLFSLVAFLLLIDYSAKLLRPVSLVARIGESGIAVIESVYPQIVRGVVAPPASAAKRKWRLLSWGSQQVAAAAPAAAKRGPPDRTVNHHGTSGIVLAVNVPALIAEAQRADCVVELAPQVGDFVAVDEPLVLPLWQCGRDRRSQAAGAGRVRHRTHDGAGPAVCVPHPGRHRVEGAVAGDQRSDHRRARHRPAAPAAAPGRPAQPAHRRVRGLQWTPAVDIPHAQLGKFRAHYFQGNPPMRRKQSAGRAPPARDDRESHADAARASVMQRCKWSWIS